MRHGRWLAVAAALCALTAITGCSRAGSDQGGTARVRVDGSRNSDFWWYTIDDDSLGAVWLGPRLAGEVDGGFRFVNLIFHDPSCESPAAMCGSVALLRSKDPVAIANGSIEFRVAPIGDLTWADVTERRHLKVALDRTP